MELKATKEGKEPLVLRDREGHLERLERMEKRARLAHGVDLVNLECQVILVFRERKDFLVVEGPKDFLACLEGLVSWCFVLSLLNF